MSSDEEFGVDTISRVFRLRKTAPARRATGAAVEAVTEDLQKLVGRAGLVVLVGESVGRRYRIGDELVIGRRADATIQINHPDVSRTHARIKREGRSYTLQDLGSHNGTLVNGLSVREKTLEYGDKIQVGTRTVLLFTPNNSVEEQLLQAQKMESVGRLAGGLAHDFNNLLGAVLNNVGYLETLGAGRSFTEPEVRECLSEIKSAIMRAAGLTRQLLGFARRGKFEECPVDLVRLVTDTAALARRTFGREIQVRTVTGSNLTVLGDPSQLQQVLMNLCLNARDAMPEGGELVLSAAELVVPEVETGIVVFLSPGSYVALSVRDNGCGMDEETAGRIFDPFFTTKPPGHGGGMGLATVYGIVKNHGGHIQVVSRPREGTTFHIYFPAVEVPHDKPATSPSRPEAVGVKPLVLVVDDEDVVRKSTCRLLGLLGYQALPARDGREGVELFEKYHDKVTFVLLDLVMPVMTGGEVFHHLRKIDPNVRVLIASGYTDEGELRQLLSAGASGFLAKPFDRETLAAQVAKLTAGDSSN